MHIEPIGQSPTSGASAKKAVFAAIRKNAPVARVDVAAETGLSPATVTSITAELIAKGLIKEIPSAPEQGIQKRGRPRVDLQLRSKAHIVAGMKLSNSTTTVAIVDFIGNILAEFSAPTPELPQSSAQTCRFLQATLKRALKDAGMKIGDLSGVGIGLPGIVDARMGLIRWSPAITDLNTPLQNMLQTALDTPVFIENDAYVVTLAEQRFGLGKEARNFIVVTVEQGVGMGIVIDGNLIRGANGGGGELGHSKVQLDGALCRCGQRGCLEAYVGDYALLREASTIMGSDLEAAGATGSEGKLQHLLDKALAGNPVALSIFRRAGRMFAMGLANAVNILAPELIILSGERMKYHYLYDEAVVKDMQNSIVQMGGSPPEVRIHKWGDQMWAMGAATYAIEGVIERVLNGAVSDAA